MTTTDTTRQPLAPNQLIARALRVRNDQKAAGEAAALRHGLLPATEMFARPYTDVYLVGESRSSAAGWRRAAAICASSPAVQQSTEGAWVPLGASLRQLHDRENPGLVSPSSGNAIVAQVNSLAMLDMDHSSQTLALLVGRCGRHGIPVDFYALGRSLSRWGRGTNSRSRAVRNQIVSDFYQITTITNKAKEAQK